VKVTGFFKKPFYINYLIWVALRLPAAF